MARIIDRLVLILILFIIFTLWLTYLTENAFLSICISALLCVLIAILIRPKNKKVKINAENYIPKLSTMRYKEISNLIYGTISEENNPKINEKGLITLNEKTVLIPIVRMSEITADEVCKLSEKIKKAGYSKLILVVAYYDKIGCDKIKPYLAIPVEFLRIEDVLLSLQSKDKLPKIEGKAIVKRKFKMLFSSALKRQNGKYFLFSGLMMAFLSVFTPLTLYYLVFCTFTLGFAFLCFIKKKEKTPSVLK